MGPAHNIRYSQCGWHVPNEVSLIFISYLRKKPSAPPIRTGHTAAVVCHSKMIEKAKNILNKKHLLVVGSTEIERQKFVSELIIIANYETFRFPSKMQSFGDYLEFVDKVDLYKPWYHKKGKFGYNQILDFHRDWISANNSLVILEEFELMEERWKIEFIRLYLNEIENRKKGEKKIHLIISQESENGLIEKLSKVIDIKENERRTKKQIVKQKLEVIDISG
jgi:hypothetical protein